MTGKSFEKVLPATVALPAASDRDGGRRVAVLAAEEGRVDERVAVRPEPRHEGVEDVLAALGLECAGRDREVLRPRGAGDEHVAARAERDAAGGVRVVAAEVGGPDQARAARRELHHEGVAALEVVVGAGVLLLEGARRGREVVRLADARDQHGAVARPPPRRARCRGGCRRRRWTARAPGRSRAPHSGRARRPRSRSARGRWLRSGSRPRGARRRSPGTRPAAAARAAARPRAAPGRRRARASARPRPSIAQLERGEVRARRRDHVELDAAVAPVDGEVEAGADPGAGDAPVQRQVAAPVRRVAPDQVVDAAGLRLARDRERRPHPRPRGRCARAARARPTRPRSRRRRPRPARRLASPGSGRPRARARRRAAARAGTPTARAAGSS